MKKTILDNHPEVSGVEFTVDREKSPKVKSFRKNFDNLDQ
jgi:hypothetical protein